MSTDVAAIVREATDASDGERILFPEVVRMIAEAGVERYHADLVCATKTYYLPDGRFEVVGCMPVEKPAAAFSAPAVEAAVRTIQRGEIAYREFCRRIAAAGCVGYFVTVAGRRAVYYGRTGDTHVEWFPSPGR
jgi:uncharacterized protein YbcV (DUF1398 family)